MKKIIFTILIITSILYAYERRTIVVEPSNRVNIEVSVILSTNNNLYRYNYSITLKPDSEQKLNLYYFEIKDINLVKYISGSPELKGRLPNKLHFDFTWKYSNYVIEKGTTLSNLICDAEGTIGIIKAKFKGKVPTPMGSVNEPEPIVIYPTEDEEYKTILVIGPVPKPFDALSMLYLLISNTVTAYGEGWITKADVLEGLTNKLYASKKHIETGYYMKPAARNILNAFQHQLDAQRGKSIREDCYQMLYFGADELINMLK